MADVYAYGVIAPSTLIMLDDYPAQAGYAEISGIYHSIGGEAAGGAYVLARLGVVTSLDGNWLGSDDASARVIDLLTAAGVDCSPIRRVDASQSVTELVLNSGDARTVFGTYVRLLAQRAWNEPSQEQIRSSRVVCLDPFFLESSLQAATWCREAGIPYVAVDTAPDAAIARHAEVLIISEEFASRELSVDSSEVLALYADQCAGLVIHTRGSEPLTYGRPDTEERRLSPFAVTAVDTTGAGDSFRAGIIYGMLQGFSDDQLVRTAAAVAAMVCEQFPGVLHSPSAQELASFLRRHD